jgi:hypothetical protein
MKTQRSRGHSPRLRSKDFQRNTPAPRATVTAELRPFQPVLLASLRNQLSAHESQAALTALARAVCHETESGSHRRS